jgi:hypothetical protein
MTYAGFVPANDMQQQQAKLVLLFLQRSSLRPMFEGTMIFALLHSVN